MDDPTVIEGQIMGANTDKKIGMKVKGGRIKGMAFKSPAMPEEEVAPMRIRIKGQTNPKLFLKGGITKKGRIKFNKDQ